jgi:hypothetical protein
VYVDRGSPALLIRLVVALATWCVAFGLFLMAEGEPVVGSVALSLGLIALFAIGGAALRGGPDDAADEATSAGQRGLNHRRNGYGHHI